MAIAYPLSLPATFKAAKLEFSGIDIVGGDPSPFTANAQKYDWMAASWAGRITLSADSRTAAEILRAWVMSLNGTSGSFLCGDPSRPNPRGVATGVPLVDGAGQVGRTLATKGWTNGVAGILKAFDLIQLGAGASAHLHMNLTDADASGAGKTTLDLWPILREAPADGDAITVISPKGVWRRASNRFDWNVGGGAVYGSCSFDIEENL